MFVDVCPVLSDPRVELLEQRAGPSVKCETTPSWRFGTYGCGLNLLPSLWSTHELVFEVDPSISTGALACPTHRDFSRTFHPARVPMTMLADHPVDVLVADHSTATSMKALFGSDHSRSLDWHKWLLPCPSHLLPKVIIQLWPADTIWQDPGPTSKHARKPLERLGYEFRYRVLQGTSFGGSVTQARLIVVCFKTKSSAAESDVPSDCPSWDFAPSFMGERPMSNCLRPHGAGPCRVSLPPGDHHSPIPHASCDPMPSRTGQWISTDDGYRRLHVDELARGLGVPKTWISDPKLLPRPTVDHLVSVHLWEGITQCLSSLWPVVGLDQPPIDAPLSGIPPPGSPATPPLAPPPDTSGDSTPWVWEAPNLGLNGSWYRKRRRSLKLAAQTFPLEERAAIVDEGLADLARHRLNYGPCGPRQLQLLWWEFPAEHWPGLRTGSSMNFLTPPPTGLTENAKLDAEQAAVAGEFVEELIKLKIIRRAPPDDPILMNCPLFVVPKPGQPGQWRIIADCKKGGQNAHIGALPVFLPQAQLILKQLYSGGWTAVVDASKFFYQFPTVISERKYLGLVHPITGAHYHYCGLPMGTAASPGIAGQFGAGFLRRLRTKFPEVFGGVPVENTWRRHVAEHTYDDQLGHGRALISADGSPAVLAFGFGDDFALHGPTYAKTITALNCFMDYAVQVGLLCNPAKVNPPSQEAKYCGFIFDTRGMPTLRVPEGKRSRARAMVDYLLSQRGSPIPRLSLSVITGLLESQVPATPSQLGHTYLRRVYDAVWASDATIEPTLNPRDRYYVMVSLTPGAWDDLLWWHRHLASASGRAARPARTATLVAHFGDGSGTGTGGTSQTVGGTAAANLHPLEMWMGRWDHKVHSFSSNWRELKTLELTLRLELARTDDRARDTTLFYFTDNVVTYFVVNNGSSRNPQLQALIYSIKALEQALGCMLECVHIPGTSIIDQGSDDLSRAVWMSEHRSYIPASVLIPRLFEGVRLHQDWISTLRRAVPTIRAGPLVLRRWDSDLDGSSIFDRCTVWAPPVEMADGVLAAVLTAWTERPATTSAVFLLPRVLQRQWSRMSRFLITVKPIIPEGSSAKKDCFVYPDPAAPIYHRLPIVILYLPLHVPTLPSVRVESTASSIPWEQRQWFDRQKEDLYRMSAAAEADG